MSIETLRETIMNARGPSGEQWFQQLPEIIPLLANHWSLSAIQPVANMSWNYVAFALQNAQPVVLKIGADKDAIQHEYEALHHFSGISTIQIIDFHPQYGALLLQRATPGILLKTEQFKIPNRVIQIYAKVVRDLSCSKRPEHAFPHVKEWCASIEEMNDPRIPIHYIEKAKSLRTWIFETMTNEYICHGDLHLENIIQHQTQWLAIDPKGIVGEMTFEAAAFDLLTEKEQSDSQVTTLLQERIQQLAQALNLNEDRLHAWVFLRTLLSIQWFIEDRGDPTKMLKMADQLYPLVKQVNPSRHT